ncbi:MAG: CopG family transcriptional regulator [Chloroflexia bacterium]|nr:CopG family transcriptional regulator [Chloroflexia bacterium]
MKRTTVLLPDDLAYLLDRERRRRGVSMAAIVREAIAAHFNITGEPRQLPFAALGHSGLPDLGANDEYYFGSGVGLRGVF